MGVPPFVGSDAGGRDGESVVVRPKEVEYGRAVYCKSADSGLLRGGDVEDMYVDI